MNAIAMPSRPAFAAVREELQAAVARGAIAGVVALAWREGQASQVIAEGWRDRAAAEPMAEDALFHIASMTKPITSTLALMMVEDGACALDDDIARWAPEFARMQVLRAPDGPLDETYAAPRPITLRDLLSQRAGFTYSFIAQGPLGRAYEQALGSSIDSPLGPDAWMAALAGLPLRCAPGARFCYGHATDLLGFILARIAGEPIEALMRRRILAPLGMTDTGFDPPAGAGRRIARPHGLDADGQLVPRPSGLRRPGASFASAGQGLWSTAADYLRFARLLVGRGEVDGLRLLRPESVELMLTDTLSVEDREGLFVGMPMFAGHGFGLGLAMMRDPAAAFPFLGQGAAGSFGWPGALGTWWQADPTARTVLIYLVQVAPPVAGAGAGHLMASAGAQMAFERAAAAALAA